MSTPEDQRGSPSATEEVQLLFVRHENSIRAFVRALQPSLADADDVLQETFLTVSRKASTFHRNGRDSFTGGSEMRYGQDQFSVVT